MSLLREPISKKMRFDVFKRDCFRCQYCGKSPPAVVLEIDHIHTVKAGGRTMLHNLLTACFDCNRGKGAALLSSIPQSLSFHAEQIAERLAQVKAYERLIKQKVKQEEKQIDEVQNAFSLHFPDSAFSLKFRQSVRNFIQILPTHEVVSYMHFACSRILRKEDSLKYFCGVCWKNIKSQSKSVPFEG